MRIVVGICMLIAGLASAMSPARAIWVHQTNEDPFQGDLQIAMAAEAPGYALGFRCRASASLDMLFLVPEKLDPAMVETANALGEFKMLVIVDQSPKVEIATMLSSDDDTRKISFRSEGPEVSGLVFAAMVAKKRVAVAIEFNGKIIHSVTFDAVGSTRALGPLVEACELKPPATN